MKVLVACEFSQVVTKAFRDKGHEAYSCDIIPTEGNSDWHLMGDVMGHLVDDWDMMIAHPPCTYLCNSGVRWLKDNPVRWEQMLDSARFFRTLLAWSEFIPRICIENPIQHRHAGLPKYDQIIHPWQFGHGESKSTCLWLRGLPKLQPTDIVAGRVPKVHYASPGPDRWKERSRTYQGIAKAMAEQWS